METETILFIIAIILSFVINAFGSRTAAGLDRGRKRRHLRRFAFLSLMPFCSFFIITLPVVVNYSHVGDIDPIDQVELNTLENVSKSVSSQEHHIKALERDVVRLREDLQAVNDYYHRLVYGLLLCLLMVGLAIFISEFGEPEEGEIKVDPLDLRNDQAK